MNVVGAMGGQARNIIGSSELERSFSDADGQNMTATLGALIENPNQTPEQFANRTIELARSGANDDTGNTHPDENGTETLAHFNPAAYPQFASAMDQLGASLMPPRRRRSRR